MKKLGFSLLLVIGSFSSLKAQDGYPTKGDVSILAKIGVNGALYVDDAIKTMKTVKGYPPFY